MAKGNHIVQLQEGASLSNHYGSMFWLCLLFSIILWCGLLTIGVSYFGSILGVAEFDWELPVWVYFVTVAAAVAYLIEAFTANTIWYLANINEVEDVIDYIDRLSGYSPTISLSTESYHHETRTRTVSVPVTKTSYDYQGRSTTTTTYEQRTETYQEKVVTHRETQPFEYRYSEDCSGRVTEEIYRFNATRVDFSKEWIPADEQTKSKYEALRNDLISRNKPRDSGFSIWENFEIQDFRKHTLCLVDLDRKPVLMHWTYYMLFILFCSAWFYRRWFDKETVYGTYTFKKRIYT